MTTSRELRVPLRTCVGCRRRRPQHELLRCALGADGSLCISRVAPGRGAWLCGRGCLAEARRRGGFDRAFRRPVAGEAVEHLDAVLAGDDARHDGGGTNHGGTK